MLFENRQFLDLLLDGNVDTLLDEQALLPSKFARRLEGQVWIPSRRQLPLQACHAISQHIGRFAQRCAA